VSPDVPRPSIEASSYRHGKGCVIKKPILYDYLFAFFAVEGQLTTYTVSFVCFIIVQAYNMLLDIVSLLCNKEVYFMLGPIHELEVNRTPLITIQQ
jgi:hypothetical protein